MTSTEYFVPIEDIKEDLIFLKDGGVSLVISTSAVNFGLLFENEQISIISSFAGLLNSLSFPIQIVIHSRRLDVSSYLHTLDKVLNKQTNPKLSELTVRYRNFVESIIKEKNVLDKQFYICLLVTPAEMGILPKKGADKTKRALTVLLPRRDHLIRQLGRLGLKARQLNTVELVKLFYDLYNPVNNDLVINNSQKALPKVLPLRRFDQTKIIPQPTTPQPPLVIPPLNNQPSTMNLPAGRQDPSPIVTTTRATSPFVVEELNDE